MSYVSSGSVALAPSTMPNPASRSRDINISPYRVRGKEAENNVSPGTNAGIRTMALRKSSAINSDLEKSAERGRFWTRSCWLGFAGLCNVAGAVVVECADTLSCENGKNAQPPSRLVANISSAVPVFNVLPSLIGPKVSAETLGLLPYKSQSRALDEKGCHFTLSA